jgi:hypothetical protein
MRKPSDFPIKIYGLDEVLIVSGTWAREHPLSARWKLARRLAHQGTALYPLSSIALPNTILVPHVANIAQRSKRLRWKCSPDHVALFSRERRVYESTITRLEASIVILYQGRISPSSP